MEIFYYSGTGFTLAAARAFAAHIDEEVRLRPIVQLMREGATSSDAEKIGLFMPMHAFGLPSAFIRFLREFRFPRASFICALVTRGGAPTRMHMEIDRLLRRQGKRLNAFQYVTTPNTFDIIFHVPEGPEVLEAQKRGEEDIRQFAAQVNRGEAGIHLGYRNRFHENFTFPILRGLNRMTGYFNLQNSFYADGTCTGCGQCEEVCLSGRIRMKDNRPVWDHTAACQYCLACLHLCPVHAVQVKKSKTPELGRIRRPDVSWKEIAAQK
ncbi:MAG: EFR1 family ferrodoxin [Sediminispirochaetaceae bacterium]